MLTAEQIRQAIPHALSGIDVAGGMPRGKVRDFFVLPDGRRRVLITTDRLSAFDHNVGLVPYKGQVLNQLSAWWFDKTRDIVPNHFISMPDPNVTLSRETHAILIEVVVRGYITGTTSTSLWTRYEAGEREIYGIKFPDGLRKNEPLHEAIITPTTKTRDGHDERLTNLEVVERGYVNADIWEKIQVAALALFKRGQELAAGNGLILVDTKYEFGLTPDTGEITLIDEIHTPDSSRFWDAHSYPLRLELGSEPENFDKELVRLWYVARNYRGDGVPPQMSESLIIATSERYQAVYERLTGLPFEPAVYPAEERIERVIKKIEKDSALRPTGPLSLKS
jgi:phosphoribosylaminoimidazole-succinocarboxamide synthase